MVRLAYVVNAYLLTDSLGQSSINDCVTPVIARATRKVRKSVAWSWAWSAGLVSVALDQHRDVASRNLSLRNQSPTRRRSPSEVEIHSGEFRK